MKTFAKTFLFAVLFLVVGALAAGLVSFINDAKAVKPVVAADLVKQADDQPAVRFTVYKDTAGEWRWRAQARNWKITADSAEGYTEKRKCVEAVNILIAWIRAGSVEVIEQ